MELFHNITVESINKTTSDCSVVQFKIPNHLRDSFSYKQGQQLTLRKIINGEDIRRTYSLCSSPMDREWKVAIKQIPGGIFSTYANNELKTGDTLELMKPSGNFFVEVEADNSKNYVAFAAGSGITPILSIIKTHLEVEPNSTFKLFYVNKTAKSIILKEEIEQLKNLYFDRLQIFYFLTKEKRDIPLLNGRFTKKKLQLLTESFINMEDTDDCFICGPQEMIFLIRDELQALGLSKNKIHYELFFSGNSEEDKKHTSEILERKAEEIEITVIDGGKEFRFTMDEEHDNILDGALGAGADLPFACKGGVCSTCKCKVLKGSVEMKVNYALDENEVAQKLVLSCQAVPTSKKVVIDFDI